MPESVRAEEVPRAAGIGNRKAAKFAKHKRTAPTKHTNRTKADLGTAARHGEAFGFVSAIFAFLGGCPLAVFAFFLFRELTDRLGQGRIHMKLEEYS